MSHNVEDVKKQSNQLRGTIGESLSKTSATFDADEKTLIKFHGMYQEDDRDERVARQKAKQDPRWILMVRTKIPGGGLTGEQYIAIDRLATLWANGTLRITTRQDIQFHGVLKANVRDLVRSINEVKMTTFGGCGDVERNVMASPMPFHTPAHQEVQKLAREVSHALLPSSNAYFEVWLGGKKVELSEEKADPLYGPTYLPRKFKTAIIVPPDNDVDIYAHDLGFIAYAPKGEIEGFTVIAGGGFGMDHGKVATYPFLSVPIAYIKKEHIKKEHIIDAAKAMIGIHRDFGDRENRKHARLKFIIAERGVDFVKAEFKKRFGKPCEEPHQIKVSTVADKLGWHEQGDPQGRMFCTVKVECGRIKDYPQDLKADAHLIDKSLRGVKYRTAFKRVVERFKCPVRLTPNQNILFYDLKPSDRAEFEAILKEHNVPTGESLTQAHQMGIACVALPTCGLALSESERVFPTVMEKIDVVLKDLNLEKEHILFRMTGCPNGCARPYNADFAFVGRGIGKYAFYIGGSFRGDRMAGLVEKSIELEEIPDKVRTYLEEFAKERKKGEAFSDYWGRTHENGPPPHPSQFHEELAAREAKMKAEGKTAGLVG
jgi:sulfite reductase beta subunit-like hemoprotein